MHEDIKALGLLLGTTAEGKSSQQMVERQLARARADYSQSRIGHLSLENTGCQFAIEVNHIDTFLIIDDHPRVNRAICNAVRAAGHTQVAVLSGQAALAAIDAGVVDIIILDYLMPGMDGIQVLGILRRDPRTETVPIVIHRSAVDPALQVSTTQRGYRGLAKGECNLGQTIDRLLREVQG